MSEIGVASGLAISDFLLYLPILDFPLADGPSSDLDVLAETSRCSLVVGVPTLIACPPNVGVAIKSIGNPVVFVPYQHGIE